MCVSVKAVFVSAVFYAVEKRIDFGNARHEERLHCVFAYNKKNDILTVVSMFYRAGGKK